MAHDAGSQEAAALLAFAARRVDRDTTAHGPAATTKVDGARRQASLQALSLIVPQDQGVEPSPPCDPVHDIACDISVSFVPLHGAHGHCGWILDCQPESNPARTNHRHVREYH